MEVQTKAYLKGIIWFELGVNSHCRSVRVNGESIGKVEELCGKEVCPG